MASAAGIGSRSSAIQSGSSPAAPQSHESLFPRFGRPRFLPAIRCRTQNTCGMDAQPWASEQHGQHGQHPVHRRGRVSPDASRSKGDCVRTEHQRDCIPLTAFAEKLSASSRLGSWSLLGGHGSMTSTESARPSASSRNFCSATAATPRFTR